MIFVFFFQAEDGIRDADVTGVQTCALPISSTTAQKTTLGGWDARAQGLGGWTLSVHHAYDPIGGVLYLGDGSKRSALTLGQSIVTVAGNGTAAFAGDSGPATRASLSAVAVLAAPDGSFYLSDQSNLRIRKVSPDGTILTDRKSTRLNSSHVRISYAVF